MLERAARERGELGQRAAEGAEIARGRAVDTELHREPFEVGDDGQLRSDFRAKPGLGDEELDRVETAPDLGDARERREEAAAE